MGMFKNKVTVRFETNEKYQAWLLSIKYTKMDSRGYHCIYIDLDDDENANEAVEKAREMGATIE